MSSTKQMSEDPRTFYTSSQFLAEDYPDQYVGATVNKEGSAPVYVIMATGRGIPKVTKALDEAGIADRLFAKTCEDLELYRRLDGASAITLSEFCPEGQALVVFRRSPALSLIVVNDRELVEELTAWGILRTQIGEEWN